MTSLLKASASKDSAADSESKQAEGGQPFASQTKVPSQQDCFPTTSNDNAPSSQKPAQSVAAGDGQDILTTKKHIANRRWEEGGTTMLLDNVGATYVCGGDIHQHAIGTSTKDLSVLVRKEFIANRFLPNTSSSAQKNSSGPSSGDHVGPTPDNSVTGDVIARKLSIARKQDLERVQQAQSTVRATDDVANDNSTTQEEVQPMRSPVRNNINSSSNAGVQQAPGQQQASENTGNVTTQQNEVPFDAYLVDEEEEAEYRRQRERELRQEIERREHDELVRTLPHAEEVDQEELRQQREQMERAAAKRKRNFYMQKVAAVGAAVMAIIVACVVSVTCLKNDQKEEASREDEIAWILEKVSGSAIHNSSSPRHDAFRWLVDEDPLQLSVGSAGVKSFTIVERYVVVLFFLVTGGLSNWTDTLGFLSHSSVCDWWDSSLRKGILCHDSGSVGSIQVDDNNLYGTLPDELSAIEELEVVLLSWNKLFGTIPVSLNKNRLTRISLNDNFFSGKIPDLSSLRNLEAIELNLNFLTGTLPGWVTSSRELLFLSVHDNFLSGTIPPFAAQDRLSFVFLSTNLFEGSIPPSLGSLSVLELLDLGNNFLSGTIPTMIGQATKLQDLYAYSNSLTGTIPTEIVYLQALQYFVMHYNSLTGPIPTELGGLTDLVAVYLHGNHFTGTIPPELAGLEELKYLVLANNTLTGNVSELCFNHENGGKNTYFEQLIDFYTDCDGILQSEVVCPCCTHCCNDMTGVCSQVKRLEEECQERAMQWEGSGDDENGIVCECSEGGKTVSCKDSNCMYCNEADGSLCYIDGQSGMELGIEDNSFYAVSIKYVRGRDEHVSLQVGNIDDDWYCLASINGRDCSSCKQISCPADGYFTYSVDCSNLGYGGSLSACHEGNDPFYMLWDVANALYVNRELPVRHDCVPYNTSEVFGQA